MIHEFLDSLRKVPVTQMTLNGELSDERKQVQKAFSQLHYYENFFLDNEKHKIVQKYAMFETKISDEHIAFFEKYQIKVIWLNEKGIIESKEGYIKF